VRIELGKTASHKYIGLFPPLDERKKIIYDFTDIGNELITRWHTGSGVPYSEIGYKDEYSNQYSNDGDRQLTALARQIAQVLRHNEIEVEIDETIHPLERGVDLFDDQK
jgi:hypothetical protein